MSKTPEERLASLEENFRSMGEGIIRLEKAIEKLDTTVSALVDKLDARYPSKESVDLRFETIVKENEDLRKQVADNTRRLNKLTAWQYKMIGGIGVIAFALGIVARAIWK